MESILDIGPKLKYRKRHANENHNVQLSTAQYVQTSMNCKEWLFRSISEELEETGYSTQDISGLMYV